MAQATDIVLNGAGYMIQPGSPQSPGYKRLQDGHPEGLTQRTTLTDFFGGQRRSHQLERDTFYDSNAIGPALGGQGVTPWAYAATQAQGQGFIDLPSHLTRAPHVIVRDNLYVAFGKELHRHTILPDQSSRFWHIKTYDHEITDLTIYGSIGILIAFGSAADIIFRHTGTNSETTLFAGDRAHRIEAYNGYAIWIDARTASTPTVIRMVTGVGIDFRHVSYDAFAMATVGGELLIITKQALFTFKGRVRDVLVPNPGWTADGTGGSPTMPGEEWTGEFEPFFQQGVYTAEHDFSFVAGYGGRTIAWIAGGVHELVPSGDRAGWRSTGLEGKRCFGGCVAAGYAIVSIESHSGNNEIWAYNGAGWWCIDRQAMPGGNGDGTWCWPAPIGEGGSGSYNVVFLTSGTNTIRWYRLVPDTHHSTGVYQPNYPANAEFISPLIDAGDRDKLKAWRKIGAVFSSPELHGNLSSTDTVGISLDYSIDAGQTWVNGVTPSTRKNLWGPNDLEHMNFDMERALSGVTFRYIMLRVRWWDVSDWAPILTGIWVEHETFQSPTRRRKWQLRIHARDQEIDRDGVVLTRTGRELIEDLWQAWETDTPMTFRDIDYDTDPVQRTVRIVGIQENATQPFDHGQWGDSLITLNLVEV